MQLFAQFIFRLSFGMSAAMLCVSPRRVSSGYYRNNLYVLLGLNVLASLLAWMAPADAHIARWPAVAAAAASYVAAAAWLYEKAGPGMLGLAVIAASGLAGAWLGQPAASMTAPPTARLLWALDPLLGGLVLGITVAAMLLGHWHLNAPGMSLAPLFLLVNAMVAAVLARAALSALGLALEFSTVKGFDLTRWLFVAMRWFSGLAGALIVALMSRQTLKIPNTQSATGILYVGVILTFVGELAAQLLSRGGAFPL